MADLDPDGEPRADRRPARADDVDLGQIVERLSWTPRERLLYLLDMVAFAEQARRARRLPPDA